MIIIHSIWRESEIYKLRKWFYKFYRFYKYLLVNLARNASPNPFPRRGKVHGVSAPLFNAEEFPTKEKLPLISASKNLEKKKLEKSRLRHWENYISISFHIEWDVIVVFSFRFFLSSFPIDFEPHGILFGSKLEGKLSPRSYRIHFERNWEYSFLRVIFIWLSETFFGIIRTKLRAPLNPKANVMFWRFQEALNVAPTFSIRKKLQTEKKHTSMKYLFDFSFWLWTKRESVWFMITMKTVTTIISLSIWK